MKNLILSILLLCGFSLSAQNIYLNNQVKNNTPSSSRTGAALEVMEPYTVAGTDTYTVSISVTGLYSGAETYTAGDQFLLTFPNANTSTTVTLNINSEGAIAVKDAGGSDPGVGDIEAGRTYKLYYNGTHFRIIGAAGGGGGGGTLTSVGLTLGTTGTDAGVSGSPLTSDGSITLNLPSSSGSNRGLLTAADWTTFNSKQAALVSGTNIKTVNSTTLLGSGNLAVGDALVTNAAVSLTDGATIDLTAVKHTLSTSAATRTFTISYAGDNITMEVTLSATSATYTFPAGSLCISEGAASGNNTLALAGVSGDKYIIVTKKIGSVYYVVAKNFGQ
jgi:hypothetical protein